MIYTEARSILEIDEARWNAVTDDVISMKHAWLRVMETQLRFFQPYYILLEDEQGPCAAVVADLYLSIKHLGLFGWLRQRISLALRPPFSSFCGVMVRPGLSLEAIMPDLDSVLRRLCRQEKKLVITVSNVGASELPAWQKAGFGAIPQRKAGFLYLPETYAQYRESLRAKDRGELGRAHRRGEKFNLHFDASPRAENDEQIYALFDEVFTRHGTATEAIPLVPQFPTALERELPENVHFVRGYSAEKLVGVGLCLQNKTTLWAPLIGMDYEIARPSYLYFLLIDATVRLGIDLGMQKLFLGKTNEHVKQRQGFQFEERWLCYRARFGPLNRILSRVLPLVLPK